MKGKYEENGFLVKRSSIVSGIAKWDFEHINALDARYQILETIFSFFVSILAATRSLYTRDQKWNSTSRSFISFSIANNKQYQIQNEAHTKKNVIINEGTHSTFFFCALQRVCLHTFYFDFIFIFYDCFRIVVSLIVKRESWKQKRVKGKPKKNAKAKQQMV